MSPTAALMCDLTSPIHHTGKVVTFYSGFCVKVGIEALHAQGVYSQALIKKKRYWPRGVPGDHIDEHFRDKAIGYAETLRQVINGKKFLIYIKKFHSFIC